MKNDFKTPFQQAVDRIIAGKPNCESLKIQVSTAIEDSPTIDRPVNIAYVMESMRTAFANHDMDTEDILSVFDIAHGLTEGEDEQQALVEGHSDHVLARLTGPEAAKIYVATRMSHSAPQYWDSNRAKAAEYLIEAQAKGEITSDDVYGLAKNLFANTVYPGKVRKFMEQHNHAVAARQRELEAMPAPTYGKK